MPSRPARSLSAAAAAALTLVALTACNDDDAGSSDSAGPAQESSSASASSSEESPTASEPTSSDTASAAPGADVQVLDEGDEPQQELRLDVEQGQVETTTMDLKVGTSVPGSPTMELPMSMTMVTTIDEVTDSQITVSFEYRDISADLPDSAGAAAQQQMDQALDAVEGVSGTLTMTPSGQVVSTHFAVPDDAPPTISSMLDQLANQSAQVSVPFPSEPVGEGARWQVETKLGIASLTTHQTATYTLDSVDGDDYSITVHLEQDIDGSGSGATVSGHTTADGSLDGTLQSFVTTSGSIQGQGTSTVELGDRKVRTTTSIDADISTELQ